MDIGLGKISVRSRSMLEKLCQGEAELNAALVPDDSNDVNNGANVLK